MRHSRIRRERQSIGRWANLGLCLLGSLLLLIAVEATGWAQVSGSVAVLPFKGSKAQGLRTLTIDLLKSAGYQVLSEGATPDASSAEVEADFAEIAKESKIRAFVLVRTALSKKNWAATVTIRDGKSGKTLGDFKLTGRSYDALRSEFKNALIDKISEPLGSSTALGGGSESGSRSSARDEPEPEPEPKAEPNRKSEPKPAPTRETSDEPEQDAAIADESPTSSPPVPPKHGPAPSALELGVGPSFQLRDWTTNDVLPGKLPGRLAPFHTVSLLGVNGSLVIYPVAFFSQSFMRHVGLDVSYERGLFGKTAINDAGVKEKRDTLFQRLVFGLRIRVPAGIAEVAVWGGAGGQQLKLSGEKVVAALPDVTTKFIRAGLGLTLNPGPAASLGAGVGYRHLLDIGDSQGELAAAEWFPNTKGAGLEGNLWGAYALTPMWRLRLAVAANRDVYTFNPDLASVRANARAGKPPPPVAGGAMDWYLTATANVVLVIPGD